MKRGTTTWSGVDTERRLGATATERAEGSKRAGLDDLRAWEDTILEGETGDPPLRLTV